MYDRDHLAVLGENVSGRADDQESRAGEFILRYDEQRISHALDAAAQRERARRRHERRWERRINIAIFVVASTVSGFFAVVVALTGGAFAFVAVPVFVLLVAYFVLLGLLGSSLD
jgi:lipopolysaccharide export LptBFGC system permease protein LptF